MCMTESKRLENEPNRLLDSIKLFQKNIRGN